MVVTLSWNGHLARQQARSLFHYLTTYLLITRGTKLYNLKLLTEKTTEKAALTIESTCELTCITGLFL